MKPIVATECHKNVNWAWIHFLFWEDFGCDSRNSKTIFQAKPTSKLYHTTGKLNDFDSNRTGQRQKMLGKFRHRYLISIRKIEKERTILILLPEIHILRTFTNMTVPMSEEAMPTMLLQLWRQSSKNEWEASEVRRSEGKPSFQM